jgi:hypothetical protein
MKKNVTISDLEKYFVGKFDKGASADNLLKDFANIAGIKFVHFKYRFPDSYGILMDDNIWINLFYNANRDTFGYQFLNMDGTIHSVHSSLNSDCSIVDLIIRLAPNIGKFSISNNRNNRLPMNENDSDSDDDSNSSSEYDD